MDDLSAGAVAPSLTTRRLGRAWRHLETCGSTNDEAAAWAIGDPPAPDGAVVVADRQTGGRGRRGRSWHAVAGESLCLSLVLRPALVSSLVPTVGLAAALALAEAVEGLGARPRLKWPNDVLVDGRKMAGVLAEASWSGSTLRHLVLGIGVNVAVRAFPPALSATATSLSAVLGRDPGRAAVACALLARLEPLLDGLAVAGPAEVVAAWRRRCDQLGRRVTVLAGGRRASGIAEDLSPEGRLLLRGDDGVLREVPAGEIT